jgi:hypothetical protein
MSPLPDYIPAKAPGQTVTDLSGTLSGGQLVALDNMGKTLNFKARVVLLPKNYKAANAEELHSLATDIASAWHVEGNRLLLVVDLGGKKLRAIAGDDLKNQGITNEFLGRTVWPNYFYPAVRKGDIEGALTDSLKAIQAKQLAYTSARVSGSSTTGLPGAGPIDRNGTYGRSDMIVPRSPGLSDGHSNVSSFAFLAGLLVVAVVAIYLIVNNSNKDKSKRLNKAFTERLGKLYATADELGQASEYIAPQSNKELALKVSAFFEKLQALDKAKDEIEKLTASKRWGKANEGLLPALKLTDKLNSEGESLLESVSAITGGVDSMKLESKDKEAIAQSKNTADGAETGDGTSLTSEDGEKSHRIKINVNSRTPYQRPNWTYNQEYNQPLFINSGPSVGIFDTLFLLNQMDTGRRLDNLERNAYPNYSNPDYSNSVNSGSVNSGTSSNSFRSDNSTTDSGGDWSSSSDSSDSSGSSSNTDSGGDWGDSSGSSGSSDSSDVGSGSDSGGDW